MMSAAVRPATRLDRDAIRVVHLRAFPASENERVAVLATRLLDEEADPGVLAWVAEIDGSVVGHVGFSPLRAAGDAAWLGYLLAPLGVDPGHQRSGIGSALVASGVALLSRRSVDALFVYGDPKYYGRFGFSAGAAAPFVPPCDLQYPFGWQARVLHGGRTGAQSVRLSCVPALQDPLLW